MPARIQKVAIGCGGAFILGCVAIGFLLSTDTASIAAAEELRSEIQSFESMPHSSPAEYSWTADRLLEKKGLKPIYITYRKNHVELAFAEPRMLWEKILEPTSRVYRIVEIRDSTGSFEHRWKSGLYREFGFLGGSKNPTGPDFQPKRGEIKITGRRQEPPTRNLLDYLDFEFK